MHKVIFIFLLSVFSGSQTFAQKSDKKEDVPLTLSLLEKCMYLGIDSVEKLIAPTGFIVSGTPKQMEELKDKWKPNRYVLMSKGKVELVIVYSSFGVFHFTVRSESTKDKTGENLLLESFKVGYKEITHDGENPRVAKSGKMEARYNTENKPWTFDLNAKK